MNGQMQKHAANIYRQGENHETGNECVFVCMCTCVCVYKEGDTQCVKEKEGGRMRGTLCVCE